MNQTESHSLKEKKMSKFDAFLAILQKKVTKFSEKLHFCKNKMKKNTFFNRKNEKKCIHLIIYTISVPMTPKLSLLMIFW